MKQRMQTFVVMLAMVFGVGVLTPLSASAINVFQGCDGTNDTTAVCKSKNDDKTSTLVQNIINILLFVIGVISVLMIIVGGIRYVLSNGDPTKVNSAKDTVLYAVIGLAVALLAYAIVNFVVNRFS